MEITYRGRSVGTIEFAHDLSTTPASATNSFDSVTLGIPFEFRIACPYQKLRSD
jgi:hypothetical protein